MLPGLLGVLRSPLGSQVKPVGVSMPDVKLANGACRTIYVSTSVSVQGRRGQEGRGGGGEAHQLETFLRALVPKVTEIQIG